MPRSSSHCETRQMQQNHKALRYWFHPIENRNAFSNQRGMVFHIIPHGLKFKKPPSPVPQSPASFFEVVRWYWFWFRRLLCLVYHIFQFLAEYAGRPVLSRVFYRGVARIRRAESRTASTSSRGFKTFASPPQLKIQRSISIRLDSFIRNVDGKRLTYERLTA